MKPIEFYAVFIPLVVLFALFIWFVGTRLYEKVPQRAFLAGVLILIAGIVGGVVMMFQPFVFNAFPVGFWFVFVSLIGFMVWSHVQPRTREVTPRSTIEETASASGAGGEPAGKR